MKPLCFNVSVFAFPQGLVVFKPYLHRSRKYLPSPSQIEHCCYPIFILLI